MEGGEELYANSGPWAEMPDTVLEGAQPHNSSCIGAHPSNRHQQMISLVGRDDGTPFRSNMVPKGWVRLCNGGGGCGWVVGRWWGPGGGGGD